MSRDRAVSVTVSYTLTLTIATLLIGGLLMSTGSLLGAQTERAVHEELDVIGQTLAANLMSADRLVTVGGHDESDVEVRVDTTLPDRVAGSSYTIQLHAPTESDPGELVLSSTRPEVEVRVAFVAKHFDEDYEEVLRGGNVEIYTVDGTLEVRSS